MRRSIYHLQARTPTKKNRELKAKGYQIQEKSQTFEPRKKSCTNRGRSRESSQLPEHGG